ncbi:hypothetical protein M427DRAFT_54918 [Gonapodya prolifera JEL478]|uniref:C2H2-type domain-containing protein n=1 Tax=Gonapodya prolifera (strain JEL478) TaxID=1344416 RepID=A0A139AL78_GONPJ|nr:hypothetical protein M427DRAFT_54918 [Gonapodya prolifera JEL478]|eukprot:KXS17263.1 hypothetical protein M427DRAFT_54918 [Gonapodya prolifera JEL478]
MTEIAIPMPAHLDSTTEGTARSVPKSFQGHSLAPSAYGRSPAGSVGTSGSLSRSLRGITFAREQGVLDFYNNFQFISQVSPSPLSTSPFNVHRQFHPDSPRIHPAAFTSDFLCCGVHFLDLHALTDHFDERHAVLTPDGTVLGYALADNDEGSDSGSVSGDENEDEDIDMESAESDDGSSSGSDGSDGWEWEAVDMDAETMKGLTSLLAPQPVHASETSGIRISDIVRGAAPDDADLPFAFDDLRELAWPDTPHARKVAAALAGMRPRSRNARQNTDPDADEEWATEDEESTVPDGLASRPRITLDADLLDPSLAALSSSFSAMNIVPPPAPPSPPTALLSMLDVYAGDEGSLLARLLVKAGGCASDVNDFDLEDIGDLGDFDLNGVMDAAVDFDERWFEQNKKSRKHARHSYEKSHFEEYHKRRRTSFRHSHNVSKPLSSSPSSSKHAHSSERKQKPNRPRRGMLREDEEVALELQVSFPKDPRRDDEDAVSDAEEARGSDAEEEDDVQVEVEVEVIDVDADPDSVEMDTNPLPASEPVTSVTRKDAGVTVISHELVVPLGRGSGLGYKVLADGHEISSGSAEDTPERTTSINATEAVESSVDLPSAVSIEAITAAAASLVAAIQAQQANAASAQASRAGQGSSSSNADKKKGKGASKEGEKKFKCTFPGCDKTYKNPNGLKYHALREHQVASSDMALNKMMLQPYGCTVVGCDRRYRNQGGLKYHLEHAHSAELKAYLPIDLCDVDSPDPI